MKKKKAISEGFKVKGVFRIHIVNEDGSLAGDSGWMENTVTCAGLQYYLAGAAFGNAGSLQVSYMALGSGTTCGTNDTTLNGEVMASTSRTTISKTFSSKSTSNGSATQWCYATFPAGFITGAGSNLSNVGLFNSSNSGTLFAGNTYTSSACASNQAVNVTYQIQMG
jgi:hypothetical protein